MPLATLLNSSQFLISFFVNIVKAPKILEKEEFVDISPGPSSAEENMDASNSDVEQTNCVILEFTANKEVQTHFDDIKMFRTIGTQTEHFHVQRNPSMHPDDINKLHHLEDHSYSLGPNTEHVKDENTEIMEPCPIPCMPDFK